MKLVLRFLSIVIAVSVLFSCNKESGDLKSIEGTWGLVHFETYTKKDVNDYYDKIKNTDEEIITLKAQIEEMKKEIDAEAEKEGVF